MEARAHHHGIVMAEEVGFAVDSQNESAVHPHGRLQVSVRSHVGCPANIIVLPTPSLPRSLSPVGG